MNQTMSMKRICICGSGTMGSGIAQAAATGGFYTILYEPDEKVLEKATSGIEKNLLAMVDKKKITTEEKHKIFQQIQFTNDIHNCLGDIIIEAIIEKIEIKIALFNQLAEINHSETIFATNTSSLSVTKIAEQVKNPERVIGMHFFNPAPLMKLIEIVTTKYTNTNSARITLEIAQMLGKTPVVCKDAPGFIVNRVARPYYIESLRVAETGIVDFATIDSIMEETGFKMGPFKLMDLIGNDVNYAVSCSVYEQLNRPERLKPSILQKQKVEKGDLGRKTGKGYFEY